MKPKKPNWNSSWYQSVTSCSCPHLTHISVTETEQPRVSRDGHSLWLALTRRSLHPQPPHPAVFINTFWAPEPDSVPYLLPCSAGSEPAWMDQNQDHSSVWGKHSTAQNLLTSLRNTEAALMTSLHLLHGEVMTRSSPGFWTHSSVLSVFWRPVCHWVFTTRPDGALKHLTSAADASVDTCWTEEVPAERTGWAYSLNSWF